MDNKPLLVPGAGVVIVDRDRTVLVRTHKGNYSFPKGKRKKNETDIQTAWREVREETGISPSELDFVPGLYVDELGKTGSPSVRYFVAHYEAKCDQIFQYDRKELADVRWVHKEELMALDSLKPKRKQVYL
jgi:8-oxo-dGTP pyrophosphatase MutT (NUDIX family)